MKYLQLIILGGLFFCITLQGKSQQDVDSLIQKYRMLSIEELLDITVTTAGKKEETIENIPASVEVITREEIERFGYASLNEILLSMTAVYGIDQRDVAGMIYGIRGYWSSTARNVIVLINGVRQERLESDGAEYPAQYIPVESIDRIEVIKGPMSVIYGPGAFFGAINIITNNADNKSSIIALLYFCIFVNIFLLGYHK